MFDTYVVSFVEYNHGRFTEFLGDQVSNLRVQKVMVTVDDDVCVNNLKNTATTSAHQRMPTKHSFFLHSRTPERKEKIYLLIHQQN